MTGITPIVEHWPDDELQFAADHPEGLDPALVSLVRSEMDRREKDRARELRAREQAREAREKVLAYEAAERRRKELEQARETALRDAPVEENNRKQHVGWLERLALQAHSDGNRTLAFVLETVAHAFARGREAEMREMLRGTVYAEKWAYTHPREQDIIVTFNEVFPEQPSSKRKAS